MSIPKKVQVLSKNVQSIEINQQLWDNYRRNPLYSDGFLQGSDTMDIKEFAAEKAIDLIFHEIDKDPEAAIRKVTDLVLKLDIKDGLHNQRPTLERVAKDPDNVWHKYVLDMFQTVDRDVLKKILINFVYHANV